MWTTAAYWRTYGPSQFTWSKGWQLSGTVLCSKNERGKLLQWLCHDDSTINIVMSVIIIILALVAAAAAAAAAAAVVVVVNRAIICKYLAGTDLLTC